MTHEFIETLPDDLSQGVIYVSIPYGIVAHKCACGCGNEVITPLSPTDWRLTFDGDSITLFPSIGNWNFPCRSHYWIENDEVKWSYQWSDDEIKAGRIQGKQSKARYYQDQQEPKEGNLAKASPPLPRGRLLQLWVTVKKWFS